jgi:hypothetical protein
MATMKRILSPSAVVATAGLIAAACSSPSVPASSTGFDPGTCALVSACIGDPTAGFGSQCETLASALSLLSESMVSSAQKLVSSQLACALAAKDCTALKACVDATPAQVAACGSSMVPMCQGDVLVSCDTTPPSASDCAAGGLQCIQNSMTAQCGTATCDPTTFVSSCNGDALVQCFDGALASATCSAEPPSTECQGTGSALTCVTHAGETCAVVGGVAGCVGAGAACDESSFQASCEGSVVVTCTGGKIGKYDCQKLGSQVTCGHDPTSAINCVGAGTQCNDETSESCNGSVLTYCMWGTISTVDCKQHGLSGCATRQETNRTVAHCTP